VRDERLLLGGVADFLNRACELREIERGAEQLGRGDRGGQVT
jgi:hypothetical protein